MGKKENLFRIVVVRLAIVSILLLATCSSSVLSENVNEMFDKELNAQLYDQIDKSNLTEAEKKLSTDLLGLVKINTPQSSSEPVIISSGFQSSNFIPADPAKGVSEDLVHVYVHLNEGSNIDIIQPFVQEITGRDEENSVASAWISVGRLEELASMEEVRNIRTVVPPVINADPAADEESVNNTTGTEKNNYLKDGSWIKVIGLLGFAAMVARSRSE